MVEKMLFQNDGDGYYLLPNVTPEELAAWEAEHKLRWENGQFVLIPMTVEEIKISMSKAVQAYLDAGAQAKNYENILSACSYEGDPNTSWAAEGAAYKAWRSATWAYCFQVLADVEGNLRPIPTEAELIAELPTLNL